MAIIIREDYLKKLERYVGKERIVVLTGQRRVGKSLVFMGINTTPFASNEV